MPAATPSSHKRPAARAKTGADRVREARLAMRREAIKSWRSWAVGIADGGPFPKVAELLAAAAILGIESPAEALEADAESLREFDAATKSFEACDTVLAKMLEPWGGDREKLAAAVEAAEAEAKRMRELLGLYDGGSGKFHWILVQNDVRRRSRRCFPEYHDELIADEEEA